MAPAAGEMPELEPLHKQLAEAFNRSDLDAVLGMFAEDATLLPPSLRMITGRDNMLRFWQNLAERTKQISLTATNLKPLGPDMARELGRMRMKPADASAADTLGKYLLVWQHVDGQWLVESIIWNRVRNPQEGRSRQAGGPAKAKGPAAARSGYGRVANLY